MERSDVLLSLADRDGPWCHYCPTWLVLPGYEEAAGCTWDPGRTFDRCGCGRHEDGEPCVLGGSWRLPNGWAWPTVDHKVPRSRGGSDDLSNLVLACPVCNARKGARRYEDFLGVGR